MSTTTMISIRVKPAFAERRRMGNLQSGRTVAARIISQLESAVGPKNVLTSAEDLITYSFDGTAALQQLPGCVVFVHTTAEVAAILKIAQTEKIPLITRGSGTGLSGGSLPVADSIILCTVRMNKILELDRANLTILVEPGVTTLEVSDAATAANVE